MQLSFELPGLNCVMAPEVARAAVRAQRLSLVALGWGWKKCARETLISANHKPKGSMSLYST